MFDSLAFKDAPPIALLKKAVLLMLALCFITALASGHRAYFQVRSLELRVTESVLRNGSVIQTDVVASGRTPVTVRLELVQDAHTETLAVHLMPDNEWAAFDPRPQRASHKLAITSEILSRFQTGAAHLRATATGRPQWTRLPPPTVRESTVTIERE